MSKQPCFIKNTIRQKNIFYTEQIDFVRQIFISCDNYFMARLFLPFKTGILKLCFVCMRYIYITCTKNIFELE